MNNKGVTAFAALFVLIVATAASIYFYKTGQKKPEPVKMPPMPVTVDKPEVRAIRDWFYATGYAEATKSVDVRARVEGELTGIYFEDSADVLKGDLLFEIEPDVYSARLREAAALVQSARAKLDSSELDYKRVLSANQASPDSVSEEVVSQRKTARDMAAATLEGALADYKNAEINLGYTKIYAPISGRVSRNLVDEGNLVGSGTNTLLTTIVSMDELYVYFDVSEDVIADHFRTQSQTGYKDVSMDLYVGAGSSDDFPLSGKLDYIDNRVDKSTGTISARGIINNPDKMLYPGMYVRIKAPIGEKENAILIKERAICTDLSGKYVYLVSGEDNIVSKANVECGQLEGDMRVILSGITAEDTYIVEGVQKARPGVPVSPIPDGAQMNAPEGAEKVGE
ncbi:MAG: efflux RND transporter periplasmic adaptor subunit [Phycisphaerae bacterium]